MQSGRPLDAADITRRMLSRLRDVMSGTGSTQDRLDRCVRIIAADLQTEVCSIYVRRGAELLELFATEGLNVAAVHQTKLRVGEGLIGDIASNARPLSLHDAQSHPNFAYRPETGEEIYHSFLGVPIRHAGLVVGVLAVQNRTARRYRDEEIETLETFSMVLAEVLARVVAEAAGGGAGRAPMRVSGTAIVDGLGMGQAYLHQPRIIIQRVVAENPAQEIARLDAAVTSMHSALDELFAAADLAAAGEHRDVLETFRMVARDKGWIARAREAIAGGLTAEAAVQKVQNDLRQRYATITDPYLRERLADLDDLTNRLLLQLVHDEGGPLYPQPAEMILVARNLGPADLLEYDRQRMRGVVLEEGAATAHVAIVAGALGIPLLGRASGVLGAIENGDHVILDADHSQVFIRPSVAIQEQFNQSAGVRQAQQKRYRAARNLPAISRDGVDVTLQMNAGLLIDLANLTLTGAAGIGLYRTELAFMVRPEYPDVTAQRDLYERILDGAGDRPVVFRTLDAGGDKRIQSLAEDDAENPAMGWRSIRMVLDRPSMLRQQIRAMILAAAGRPFSVMFPMITSVAEFTAARHIVDLERARALKRGLAVSDQLKLGAMIEVPAAVWALDELLAQTDFVSVGSNDLAQFFFAADRGSQRLAGRFNSLSAAFLDLLSTILQRCQNAGVPVTVCGEMAGQPLAAAALVGLGYRQLSMTASAIGPVKETIRHLEVAPLHDFLSAAIRRGERNLPARLRQFLADHSVAVDKLGKVG